MSKEFDPASKTQFVTYKHLHAYEINTDTGPMAVGGISYTKKEWEEWLKFNLDGLEYNNKNAASLMSAFAIGMSHVTSKYKQVGARPIIPPEIVFTEDKSIGLAFGMINYILIKKNTLMRWSNYNPYEDVRVTINNEYPLTITPFNQTLLIGIEECHHSALLQALSRSTYLIDRYLLPSINAIPGLDYLSHEPEFIALQWQLKYAIEYNFPKITIQGLQNRLDAAFEIRHKHK